MIRVLGLSIDENLSWKDQYENVNDKVKGGLSALQRLKDILPQSKLASVYLFINPFNAGLPNLFSPWTPIFFQSGMDPQGADLARILN